MVRREAIPHHLTIKDFQVKVSYARQQQVCDLCAALSHIAQAPVTFCNCIVLPRLFNFFSRGSFFRLSDLKSFSASHNGYKRDISSIYSDIDYLVRVV